MKVQPDSEVLDNIERTIDDVQSISNEITVPPHLPLPLHSWRDRIEACIKTVEPLEYWIWEGEREKENPPKYGLTNRDLYKARELASELLNSLRAIDSRLNAVDIEADLSRAGLVVGRAGTGKSHLFAHMVAQALEERRPAILVLGQYFRSEDPWQTILAKLDLSAYSVECFLGALNAAAEVASTRCLILVDALNEARDLKNWRDHIGSFITKILQYKYLTIALSCRSEYEQLLIPHSLRGKLARVECYGFITPEEREMAAKQYLEKRGIIRPATPWLAPEFVNPLFLRTCCEGLQKIGKKKFPRGLHSIKQILRFYIDSLQIRLQQQYPNVCFPHDCIRNALLTLAKRMAQDRDDCVSRKVGVDILSNTFGSSGPPRGPNWLDILVSEGVLRKDHKFREGDDDPLASSEEVLRFTYQRFSDHLVVSALLNEINDPATAFEDDGPLRFLIAEKEISLGWQHLLPALSIQIPERFHGVELVDLFPGAPEDWWHYHAVREAFSESILWRSARAFSDRTLEPFNELGRDSHGSRLAILLRLSLLEEHPWNAEFIDKNLRNKKMPERDAFWSIKLADITYYKEHPLHQLIDWAFRADKSFAEDETLRLTALILTWCFATSSRPIRDKATKALIAVLTERPHLFPQLLNRFAEVDDLYILERLLAAGFGAVCHSVKDETLSTIAEAVFENIFKGGSPSPHLLMRDYARGIIDLAYAKGCVPQSVNIGLCRPPYKTPWPIKSVTEYEIDEIRKAVGGDDIYYSAFKWGDFERYEIEPNIRKFSSVSLTEPCPLNEEEKLQQFRSIIGNWTDKKQEAFVQLENAVRRLKYTIATSVNNESYAILIKVDENTAKNADHAESRFVELLTTPEKELYETLAVPSLFPDRIPYEDRGIPRFDIHLAKRWITKRAYEFGWTKKLFPHEPGGGIGRKRPIVERIGKKYQWLALMELIARLADNVWLVVIFQKVEKLKSNTGQGKEIKQ